MSIESHFGGTQNFREFIEELKDKEPSPAYYHMEGTAASVAEFFEKPQALRDSIEESRGVRYTIPRVALALPALLGAAASRLIYFVKGEKIKREDYDEAFGKWMKKYYICTDEKFVKKFIDTCIQNRITADEYQVVIAHAFDQTRRPYKIFDGDAFAGYAPKTINEKGFNALIILEPRDRVAAKARRTIPESKSAMKVQGNKDANEALANRCSTVWFEAWNARKEKQIAELREEVSNPTQRKFSSS